MKEISPRPENGSIRLSWNARHSRSYESHTDRHGQDRAPRITLMLRNLIIQRTVAQTRAPSDGSYTECARRFASRPSL